MNNKNSVAKDYERGTRIANRRKELGMTQDELAYQIGIGRQALSAIENGGTFKTNVEYGTIVRYGDGNIAGVFPTEQEAYEYFDLDETEDCHETV